MIVTFKKQFIIRYVLTDTIMRKLRIYKLLDINILSKQNKNRSL